MPKTNNLFTFEPVYSVYGVKTQDAELATEAYFYRRVGLAQLVMRKRTYPIFDASMRCESATNPHIANTPLLLSLVGETHVQYCQSNHAVIARVRKKGVNMSALASFLGETLALLKVQALQLAANGVTRNSLAEISALVDTHLGFEFEVDVATTAAKLDRSVVLKAKRTTEECRSLVRKRRGMKRSSLAKYKNKKGASGAYVSGGTAAALDAGVP